MRKQLKYIFTGILLLSITIGFAQRTQKDTINTGVIDVVKPYAPTISDAFKVKEIPSLDDEATETKKEIKYNIFSFPVASTFTPAKGKAAVVEKRAPVKLFDNYATLGVGTYTTVLGEVYYNHAISRNESVGGYVSHHSSAGGIEGVSFNDNFSNSKINLNYSSRLRDLAWNVKAGFQHQMYNWYGVPESQITQAQDNNIEVDHSFFDAHFGGEIEFEDTYINSGSFLFRRFGDNQGSGENRFIAKAKIDVPINDIEISTDFKIDYLGGTFDRNYVTNDQLNYGNFQIGLSSTYQLKQDDLKKFAEQFILDLAVPSVLGLKGNLGSGKTTLVKSFIRALGVEEKVTSPTFNIVRTYKKEDLTIYHVDLYRLSSIHEFYDLDLPLNEEGTLFFIEWSDMIPESKSTEWRFLDIEIVDEITRKVRY